MSGKVES